MTRAILALTVALAGCMSLAPRPDRTRYYVLDAGPGAPPPRAALPALGVGPVRLAAYLDRSEIVTRAGPARIEVATFERWGAPLDALLASALSEALREAVPAREVVTWPWPPGMTPEWTVAVDVLRFEREPDGTGVLEARWTLRRGAMLAGQGLTSARERAAAPGTGETVAALGRTVRTLARDVAAGVETARGTSPASGQ